MVPQVSTLVRNITSGAVNLTSQVIAEPEPGFDYKFFRYAFLAFLFVVFCMYMIYNEFCYEAPEYSDYLHGELMMRERLEREQLEREFDSSDTVAVVMVQSADGAIVQINNEDDTNVAEGGEKPMKLLEVKTVHWDRMVDNVY